MRDKVDKDEKKSPTEYTFSGIVNTVVLSSVIMDKLLFSVVILRIFLQIPTS